MRKKKRRHLKVPRLLKKEWVETDLTGAKIRVTEEQRGLLRTTVRHYNATNLQAFRPTPPKQAFEQFGDRLRGYLKVRGLPTDQMAASKHWTVQVEKLTKSLSPERKAAELLYVLTDTITRNGIEPHLGHIGRLMEAYSDYQISRLNSLAHSGTRTQKGREAGPLARARNRQRTLRLVRRHVREHLKRHPTHKGKVKKIAGEIRNSVSEELQRKGLLPVRKNGPSEVTIQKYIRDAQR